ncbi:MAG: thioredoxin fold domain-containing protein [Muribaculaceae bacterium]|nr:thioredoxin fold domain-containing protein [Muribaculaceae bacterium]
MRLTYISIILAAAGMISCSGGAKTEAANTTTDSNRTEAETVKAVEKAAVSGVVTLGTNAEIKPDKELPTIIDFNATWCGPCRNFAPVFEEVAETMRGKALFMSVDVDKCPVPARQFQVSSIPQVTVLMPDGRYNSAVGYMTADEFTNFIYLSTGV